MPDVLARKSPGAADVEGREALWDALRVMLQAQRIGPALQRIRRDALPLASFAQQRLWFLERLIPASATNNQTVAYRLRGTVSHSALEHALSEIVRRHEALRTVLSWSADALVQDIVPASPFVVAMDDLRDLPPGRRAELIDEHTREDAETPFDIDRVPLLRVKLLRIADDEFHLLLTVHHLAFDGWSFDVLMRELCALYSAFVANEPSPLSELAVQYADWAAWQRSCLDGERKQHLIRYWQAQMDGAPAVLRLPADRPRVSGARRRPGRSCSFEISAAVAQALRLLAKEEDATTYMVLLAAFQTLLHRYTGDEDIVVGSPIANRYHVEAERLIGLFVNALPMRVHISGKETRRELLRAVRHVVLAAYEHQDLPFEMLVQALGAPSRADTTPLFQVMFAFQNLPRSNWDLPDLSVEAWNVHNGTAKFDITLFIWNAGEGFGGLLEYDAELFDGATIEQWLKHFTRLLEAMVRDPDMEISTLPLLDEAEQRLLLSAWNDTTRPYPREASIHELVARHARESPDAVAIAHDGGTLSYAALEARANRLARHLQQHGVQRGTLVGVCLQRAPALIVSLLAVLKAGGAFVPVDAKWTATRIRTVLENVPVVIVQSGTRKALSDLNVRHIQIDSAREPIDHESIDASPTHVAADDLAYVMYTSGSTGVPKGVCVPHRGVVRLVQRANYATLTARDTFLQLAPVTFDASTFEIWGALANGATLALTSPPEPSLQEIGVAVHRFEVSILWLTSGLFEAFVDTRLQDLRPVRQLLVGGDVVSPRHAERFLREMPHCSLINCYGPTENTTFTTFHPIELSACVPGESIPIGQPVSNTQVYVLDAAMRPVPIGVAGHAYAGGDGLMRGYLNDNALTGERLVRNPFPDCPGEWLYRTGDMVRRRRDGALEFLGRDDQQVKIRGFRVELGEVEAAISACSFVSSVAVVAIESAEKEKRLRAYVVSRPTEDRDGTIAAIRDFARRHLPAHLLPADFVAVDAIPLDANGKVDRRRLRTFADRPTARAVDVARPRDARERAIVEAFEEILGIQPLGIDADFFDFGGSSLSALRLIVRLEDALAVDLPLATFYEHATPAAVADWAAKRFLEASFTRAAREEGSLVVEIKHGHSEQPLFLVPGGHGGMPEMTLYAKMLSYLSAEHAVYGFVAQGVDGRAPPHTSIETMAEAYVAAMRRRQPCGPYRLAGECVGGLIAFEMARKLQQQHEAVALLLLLDTWCPSLAGVLHYRYVERTRTLVAARQAVARRGIADVRRVLDDHVRDRPRGRPFYSLRYAVNVVRTLFRVARPWIAATWAVGKPAAGRESIAAAEANYVERAMRYRPQPCSDRVTLIVSADNERRGLAEPWRALARGGLDVRAVSGDHDSYLRDTPQAVAAALEACLTDARRSGRPNPALSP